MVCRTSSQLCLIGPKASGKVKIKHMCTLHTVQYIYWILPSICNFHMHDFLIEVLYHYYVLIAQTHTACDPHMVWEKKLTANQMISLAFQSNCCLIEFEESIVWLHLIAYYWWLNASYWWLHTIHCCTKSILLDFVFFGCFIANSLKRFDIKASRANVINCITTYWVANHEWLIRSSFTK